MKYLIAILIIIFSCESYQNKSTQSNTGTLFLFESQNIGATETYDTTYQDNSAFLTLSFPVGNDSVKIIGNYHNDDSLSFIDPTHYLNMSVKINNLTVKSYHNTNFYWDKYFELFDSIVYIKNKKDAFAILNGRPMFCNGFYCSNISCLVIKLNSPYVYTIVNTEFCDDNELSVLIHKINNKSDSLFRIPIYSKECFEKNKHISIITPFD